MFENKNELEARQEILGIVDEYCKKYHNQKQYKEGDRISYASRVYDSKEMMNLVDSALEFWLTAGRYTMNWKKLGEYLSKVCISSKLWFLCQSQCIYGTYITTSGDRRIKRGDEIITVAAGFPTTITPAISMVQYLYLLMLLSHSTILMLQSLRMPFLIRLRLL